VLKQFVIRTFLKAFRIMFCPSHHVNDKAVSVSGILLAGGESRRMGGINKALLKIGDHSIVELVSHVLQEIFSEVLVITNSPRDFEFLELPMFRDIIPGRGSLGGLYTGLKACAGDYAFLVACDMPFLSKEAIMYILERAQGYDVVVPRISGMLEPLHALYSQRCLPYIEELLAAEDLKIIDFFHKAKVLEVPGEDLQQFDPQLLFIMNINTPDDLNEARELDKKRMERQANVSCFTESQ